MATQTFAYTALDAGGARRSGYIEADDSDAAVAKLAADGRFVVDIRPAEKSRGGAATGGGRGGKISQQDLAIFTRRLADLARAGLPLDRVLAVVAEQSENPRLKVIIAEALEDVRGGLPVSQALAKHPRAFPSLFTQTLRAGEASGQFPQVAGRLAEMLEKAVARRSAIVSALVYPAILTFTAFGVVIFLMTFVIPRLAGIFKDMGGQLPATTQLLMGTAEFLVGNWLLILGALAVIIVAVRSYLATAVGHLARDKWLLTAPVFGSVVMKATVSQFSQVLGTLSYGGVPILEALEIAGMASGNRLFEKSAGEVAAAVRDGHPIAQALTDVGAFPPVLIHMVAIGEETGNLPEMLERVSTSLDFEVDTGMRRLVALVEPAIVLFMGGFVGFVVISVLLPIFQAQSLVK